MALHREKQISDRRIISSSCRRLSRRTTARWKYHEVINPGLMVHVAESGDKLWTVRVASQESWRLTQSASIATIADKYCGGFFRYTTRITLEFPVSDEKQVEPLRKDLMHGLQDGGIGAGITNLSIPRDGLHCTALY